MTLAISQNVFETTKALLVADQLLPAWQTLADSGDKYACIAVHVLSKQPSLINCFRAAHWNYATGRDFAGDELWPKIAAYSLSKYLELAEARLQTNPVTQAPEYRLPNTREIESCYMNGVSHYGLEQSSIIHLAGNQLSHKINKRVESVCHWLSQYAGPFKETLLAVDMPDWHEVVCLSFEELGERGIDNSDQITELTDWQNAKLLFKSALKGGATYLAFKTGLAHPAKYGFEPLQ